MEKNFEELLKPLQAQFNGDQNHDVDILRQYIASLDKNDPENIPVIRAIGAYCMQHFPDADFVKQAKKAEEAIVAFQNKIADAQKALSEKNYEDAIEKFNEIIGENPIESKENERKFAFHHPFEEIIYRMNFQENQTIDRLSPLPLIILCQLGTAHFELKHYDEAKQAYEKALTLNPVYATALFECIQIAFIRENLDDVQSLLTKIHPYLFTRRQLSRFYRDYAKLAILQQKYDLASTLTYISIDYEDTPQARATLNSLAKHKGTDLNKPSTDLAKARLADAKIPMGPYPPVYESAIQIGQQTRKQYPQIAKMAFGIAYDITHYHPLLRELDALG